MDDLENVMHNSILVGWARTQSNFVRLIELGRMYALTLYLNSVGKPLSYLNIFVPKEKIFHLLIVEECLIEYTCFIIFYCFRQNTCFIVRKDTLLKIKVFITLTMSRKSYRVRS